jgi:aspartate-semialdehyde dehydrogenase
VSKVPVAVLGATGSVGQRFLTLLADHPWFEPVVLTASDRSAGRPYAEAARWALPAPLPERLAGVELAATGAAAVAGCPLVFSALGSDVAGPIESELAAAGHLVVTNAGSHRMDPGVPLVVPEVNPGHLDLVAGRLAAGGGAILANPNCSTIGLALALAPLDAAFGVERGSVVTMQAVSGAGLPGVPSLLALDNLVPWIAGEEEKIETEPAKILGRLEGGRIAPHPMVVSAAANRVAVTDGHTLCVSVALGRRAEAAELRAAWDGFAGEPQRLGLPTAPQHPVRYLDAPDAPQPRLHRDLDRGMAATVGRLRPCPLFDYKFVTLSHNTLRGAAGGAVLLAELAAARGLVPGRPAAAEASRAE